jgi:CMP-2-keto-3-deoxyoctulosonic acid synthetase
MREITNIDDISNPNNVKVVVDQNNFALYFSIDYSISKGRKCGCSLHAAYWDLCF